MEKEKFLEGFDGEKFANNFPGGFFIYEAEGDERLLYANDILYRLWGCATKEEFIELTGNTFCGMVHKDDIRRVEMEIHKQIQSSEQNFDNVDYRIVRKDGQIRYIEDFGRLVADKRYGNLFYVFVMDVTEKQEDTIKREFYEYIQKLKSIFDIVRLVDVSRSEEYIIDMEGKMTKQPYACYSVWNKSRRCENCVSLKALARKGKVTKFEFIDHEVYQVTSKYMEIKNRPLILEMVSKINDDTLFGAFGQEEFVETIQSYNKAMYTDSLTGVYNRNFFDEQLKNINVVSALAFVEVDDFAEMNNVHGQTAAEQILIAVVRLIHASVHKSDVLIRYGENSFLIVFQSPDECKVEHCLENIRTKVELAEFAEYPQMHATVSIGGLMCNRCSPRNIKKTQQIIAKAKEKGNHVIME